MASRSLVLMVVSIALLGCREPAIPVQPLPPMANETASKSIASHAMVLGAGERMAWNVTWRGITVGRAELAVATNRSAITSRFRTSGMAESLRPVRVLLTTSLDGRTGKPVSARETLRLSRRTRSNEYRLATARPGGAHTMQTALGVIRALATKRQNGHLFVVFDRDAYRIDIGRATSHDDGLRVECQAVRAARPDAEPISIDLVLTPPPALAPTRIDISTGDGRVTAELIEHAR